MADEASFQANRSQMDPRRLVVIFYLVSTIVAALFLGQVAGLIFAQLGIRDAEVFEGGWAVSSLVGLLVALGITAGTFGNPRVRGLSHEVASELMKVTWPTWSETRVSTGAVIVASVVAAVVLFCIDTFAFKLMVEWLPALWGKL